MEKISIRNQRGNMLAGLLFLTVDPKGPIVVVCHGFTGTKEGHGRAIGMAEEFVRHNLNCLLFDFNGCGESEGEFEDITLSGQISDLTCVIDYVAGRGLGPVITMGRSFGGTTVICQAAVDSRVRAVCSCSAPVSLTTLFPRLIYGEDIPDDHSDRILLSNEEGSVYLKKTFFYDLPQHNVAYCAGLISPRPLLVLHGTNDEVVPPPEAALIYDQAREPKEMHYIAGADHRYTNHSEQMWSLFLAWAKKISLGSG